MNVASNTRTISNPFPGLRPFQEGEEHFYFGREKQTDALVNKLEATRFLAVIGSSGSGKSSLVNCGLRVALRSGLMPSAGTSWKMVQCRPGGNPIASLARALAAPGALFDGLDNLSLPLEDILDANLRMSKLGIMDVFEQAHLDEHVNLLVVIDQFEELFRYAGSTHDHQSSSSASREEATAFINLLLAAKAQTTCPIHIVLTMRSDFLGDCTRFEGLTEAINEGQYLVPRMTREERRMAIAGPIGVGGAKIDPLLLTRLVNELGDNPDQLSILQHALNRIWALWEKQDDPEATIGLEHYKAIGSMSCALDQHAEQAFAELDAAREQLIGERLFKALTNKATDARGVRRPTGFSMLCELTDASPEELRRVIDAFRKPSRSFLMPPIHEPLDEGSVIDISHESLMRMWKRLDQWADEEAESTQLYLRLSETAALHGKGRAGLWRDPDLQRALEWRMNNVPNPVWASRIRPGFDQAMRFLDDSRAASDVQKANELKVAAQERELEQSRAIAEEQKQRLEIQNVAARRLKLIIGGMIAMLLLFLSSAYLVRDAKTQEAVARTDADVAMEEKAMAEAEAAKAQLQAVDAKINETDATRRFENILTNYMVDVTTAKETLTQEYRAFAQGTWQSEAGTESGVDTRTAVVSIENQSEETLLVFLQNADGIDGTPQPIEPGQTRLLSGEFGQVWGVRAPRAPPLDGYKLVHYSILSRPEDKFSFDE